MPFTSKRAFSFALLLGVVTSPTFPQGLARDLGLEVLPRDRADHLEPATPSFGSRPQETPATGAFFPQEAPIHDPLRADLEGPVFAPNLTIDRERVYITDMGDATWFRGRSYKATAGADGFTYIPFLGSSAPRNFPVSFRLTAASAAGRTFDLFDEASVSQIGQRVVLDRGSVQVIYDFDVDSVEQSFALDARGLESDLTLTLRVEGELAATMDGRELVFSNALGGVRYGEAIVLDGAGRQASVASRLEGAELTLTVPHAFLRRAAGPILVDPIMTTFSVNGDTGLQRDVDVAYDDTHDQFLYVFEDQFSGTDIDIYSNVVTSTGAGVTAAYVESGSEDWSDPSVATLNSANCALVAATRDTGTTEVIAGRLFRFDTALFDAATLQISPTGSPATCYRPDVAGNSTTSAGSRFLVVWNADYGPDNDIQARTVLADGTIGSTLFLDSSLADDSTQVVVSKSTGHPSLVGRWTVAYINEVLASSLDSVKIVQLDASGAVVVPKTDLVTLQAGQTIGEVDVSDALDFTGTTPVYAVAYDQYSTPLEDTFIVFATGGTVIRSVELQLSEHAERAPDQAEAHLSTTGTEFLVSYIEEFAGTSAYTGFLTAFDFTENSFLSISERRTSLGPIAADLGGFPYHIGGGVALASRFSGGFLSSRFVAYGNEIGNSTSPDVTGGVFNASNPYSPAFQYCYGNPNSTGDRGFIRLEGDRLTTTNKTMVASALPLNSFGFFIVGDGFAAVPNPGGSSGVLCIGGTIGRYSAFAASSGVSGEIRLAFDPQAISQPSGSVVGMAGQFWQFSLWHRDSVSGSPTSNFTNAVSILFE